MRPADVLIVEHACAYKKMEFLTLPVDRAQKIGKISKLIWYTLESENVYSVLLNINTVCVTKSPISLQMDKTVLDKNGGG